MSANLLILGIGNCLMADDGVGVQAARQLAQSPPPGTMVVDVGTDFLSAVPLLESCPRVLAIDAMQAGGTPGTVYWCEASAVERNTPRGSIHEMGLLAILEFVEPQKRPEIYFLGVEPERFEYSLELSPPVAAALPQVVKKARELAAMLAPPNGNAILG